MKTLFLALFTMMASPTEISELGLQDSTGRPVSGARLFLGSSSWPRPMRTDDSDSADWVSTGTAPRTVTRSSVAGDDDSPAADVPAQNVTLSVTNRPTDRLLWSLRGRAVRRDGRPGPVEVVTPGFATLHVLAGWEFVRGFQAQALLTNLFDEAYRETPDPVAVLAPGRAFSLALSGRF